MSEKAFRDLGYIAIGLGAISADRGFQQIVADMAHAEDVLLRASMLTGKPAGAIKEWAHRYPGDINEFYDWIKSGNTYKD